MLPSGMLELREYFGREGRGEFSRWFERLNAEAARRVTTALYRLGLGNTSNVKGVGEGVSEYRIDFGPGYRVYFGRDGKRIVILLCGGEKKRQQDDVVRAQEFWRDYKNQKRSGPWR